MRLKRNINNYKARKEVTIEEILEGCWGILGREKWEFIGKGIDRSMQSVRSKVLFLYGGRKVAAVGSSHDKNHDRSRRYTSDEDMRMVRALKMTKAIVNDKVVADVHINWSFI